MDNAAIGELALKVRRGNRRAVARAITHVERREQLGEAVIRALYRHTGRAHLIGITGPPGAGKSTLVNALAKQLRRGGKTVAILAVDPTSPFTGGALLGDRVRMNDLYGDKGIFIRSMASRGQLGGLALASADAAHVLDAAGYDIVLIETVGAGQAEVDIARIAQTVLVIEAPGMGDDVQSIKAGILEIADVLVVNKADRPTARNTVRALRSMLQLGHRTKTQHHGETMMVSVNKTQTATDWSPPIVETVATDEQGIVELSDAIARHWAFLQESGRYIEREHDRVRREVERLIMVQLQRNWTTTASAELWSSLCAQLVERTLDPYAAAEQLYAAMGNKTSN